MKRPRKNPEKSAPEQRIYIPRSNGEVRFQESDVWILLGKICVYYRLETHGNAISEANIKHQIDELIKEFEHRFGCTFNDVKKAYPYATRDNRTFEYYSRYSAYTNMEYSN